MRAVRVYTLKQKFSVFFSNVHSCVELSVDSFIRIFRKQLLWIKLYAALFLLLILKTCVVLNSNGKGIEVNAARYNPRFKFY